MNIREKACSLDTNDPVRRVEILSILHTRISSGLELGENKPSDLGMNSPSDAWNNANDQLLRLVNEDPKEAFDLALNLIKISVSKDQKQEGLNRWMRTSGLTLMGFNDVTPYLINYLETDLDSVDLIDTLSRFMDIDISHLNKKEHFDGNPLGYSVLQSIYICLGLKDGKGFHTQDLYQVALERKSAPDVQPAYRIVSNFSDCAYLKDRFEN